VRVEAPFEGRLQGSPGRSGSMGHNRADESTVTTPELVVPE